ncbi:MAG: hypothetical protein SGJ23_15305 [Alphaproteobacteria bacterium]|nr:hypothetical protein [Alphaproteobacteria bacterium]
MAFTSAEAFAPLRSAEAEPVASAAPVALGEGALFAALRAARAARRDARVLF